jgi:hypothetical protein
LAGVVSGFQLSSLHCTQVIVEDVMIFGSTFCIWHDAFEDFQEFLGSDDQAGFFLDFALQRFFDFLAGFDQASGEGPVTF